MDSKGSKNVTAPLRSRHRIFLLSPANLAGIRAGYVLNDSANSDLANRLRRNSVTIGELFSFISGLYFRGKLAYASAFAAPPSALSGSFVITATAGLLRPDTVVTIDQLREWAANDIDAGDRRFRTPLDRDCGLLFEEIGNSCEVVLLGSIATSKYVGPLLPVFQERLLFPAEFVGRGDMSRGGLMLRAAQAGRELAYVRVVDASRTGKRPPKLAPAQIRRHKAASRTN